MKATTIFRKHIQYLGGIALIATAPGCFYKTSGASYSQSSLDKPRNVILVIGDGMGPQQMALLDLYYQRTGDPKAAGLDHFMRTSTHGSHLSTPAHSLVNDSACAASQLAGGCLCEPRHVGTDVHGRRCASVAVHAKQAGKKAGLISDTRLSHATPAAFGAMVADRDLEHSVASQLIESGFDLMLSGGEAFFVSNNAQCRGERCASLSKRSNFRQDGRNLLAEATARGIEVISTGGQLKACKQTPVLGLFAPLFMHNAFDEGRDEEPSLSAMTEKALALLDNPDGFFLMVEAGQIDFAGHANDAAWVLGEMIRLSQAIDVIERFAMGRSDTLVVLTADHETGGMGLSYRRAPPNTSTRRGSEDLDFLDSTVFFGLKSQKQSIAEALENCKASQEVLSELPTRCLNQTFPGYPIAALARYSREPTDSRHHQNSKRNTPSDFYPHNKFLNVARVGRAVGATHGIVWATGTHTSSPVLVMAKGPGQERFVGWQHAREIGKKLLDLTSFYPP